jgi:prepilin-type N-terminal cleavage/methylation domain-containing protein
MHMCKARSARTAKRRGFTIIELLMVVAIISVIAAWALPKFSIARYRADAAGRLVRTLMQTAQRNAITRQSNVIVSFDLTGNRVRVVQDYNNNDTLNTNDLVQYRHLEEGARFVTPNWAGVGGTTPTSPVIGTALRTVSGLTTVIFRRDGSTSSDVEVYVTTRDAVKTEYRAITATAATGKTDLYKWNGSTWLRMTQ